MKTWRTLGRGGRTGADSGEAVGVAPLTRRAFLSGSAATAAGLTIAGPTLWTQPASAAVPVAGVHLGFGAEARRFMSVSWSTPASVRRPSLELGLDPGFGLRVDADSRSAPGVDTVYHHARLDALEPGATYHYRITHDGAPPFTGTLRTAPAVPGPFRFATFGDMGIRPEAVANLRRILAADPAFCFVVGDLCYADASGGVGELAALPNDPTVWDRWLDQVAPSTSRIPWMSTVGNHEMERGAGELGYDGYLARFALPVNGIAPTTYSFRYGNVAFVALDGNDASHEIARNRGYLGERQDRWLVDSLTALRADPAVDFVVVGFHNCMFCSNAVHGSDGGNRDRWLDIFDRFTVDLVVNGHNHCYERTHPLRRGEPVADAPTGAEVDSASGTTYLTAGGAGQAEYPTSAHPVSYVATEGPGYGGMREPEAATWSSVRYLHHSIAVVDVEPRDETGTASMTIHGIAKDGSEIDRVTLRRTAT